MRAAVVIEAHVEAVEIALVRETHVQDELFFAPPLLLRAHHDGGAVRVVRADVGDVSAAHALKAHPDVGLDVLEHVPEMNGPVRVRERRGNEKSTAHGKASCGTRRLPGAAAASDACLGSGSVVASRTMGLLDGKSVVITGAGNGIGRATALLFAREGAKIVVNDLGGSRDGSGGNQEAAGMVADEIRAAGGTAVPNYEDISTREGAKAVVDTALREYGRLDVL